MVQYQIKNNYCAEIHNTLFPTFQRLNNDIEAMQKFTPSKPEVIMPAGQYINNTI
jgi:hypothetical protein